MATTVDTNPSQIKAIETRWKGYRFRSRLEARWAVFFETLGVKWRYEPEGRVDGGHSWLPDFEIESVGGFQCLIEVKGTIGALAGEGDRYAHLLEHGETVCFLGDVPDPTLYGTWFHPYLACRNDTTHHGWLTFSSLGWMFAGNNAGALAILFGLKTSKWVPDDDDQWDLEPRPIPTSRIYPGVLEAYSSARAARFDHGESPTP
jgi:hypothetical protein